MDFFDILHHVQPHSACLSPASASLRWKTPTVPHGFLLWTWFYPLTAHCMAHSSTCIHAHPFITGLKWNMKEQIIYSKKNGEYCIPALASQFDTDDNIWSNMYLSFFTIIIIITINYPITREYRFCSFVEKPLKTAGLLQTWQPWPGNYIFCHLFMCFIIYLCHSV